MTEPPITASPLLDAFERQAGWCAGAGAPFTAQVVERSRRFLAADAQAHAAVSAVADDPLAAAVALRWAAGLHHLALRGLEPWAGLWACAAASDAALDEAIATAWRSQQAHMRAALARPPQTNEVQRSAALLPGLLHVAARSGLPVALLEIGASAGLNLWCDRYRHEHGAWSRGDPAAACILRTDWQGDVFNEAGADLQVVHRAGCDAYPVDLAVADEGLRLASFVWPDQPERLARLQAARAAAVAWMREEQPALRAQSAAAFVEAELRAPRVGCATVLMHSVVWQYLGADEQAAITEAVHAAGARATARAPLAWLRFEPPAADVRIELRCTFWPGGDDRLLAECHPHGAWVRWRAGGAAG